MLESDEDDGCDDTSTHDSTPVSWLGSRGGGQGDDEPSKRRGWGSPGFDLAAAGCDMLGDSCLL